MELAGAAGAGGPEDPEPTRPSANAILRPLVSARWLPDYSIVLLYPFISGEKAVVRMPHVNLQGWSRDFGVRFATCRWGSGHNVSISRDGIE